MKRDIGIKKRVQLLNGSIQVPGQILKLFLPCGIPIVKGLSLLEFEV
jgi:hypothetical protein